MPLHAVVLDERFAAAVRFGDAARKRGLPIRRMRGDVTDLWHGELHRLWKERAVPIAGLTAYGALFCLEQLAWDRRMRVIYHGAHTCLGGGRVEHALAVPAEISPLRQDQPRDVANDPLDWSADVADLIALVESHGGWAGLTPVRRATAVRYLTPGAAFDSTLYSWVIAPPARG
jgi:hypothetical protein